MVMPFEKNYTDMLTWKEMNENIWDITQPADPHYRNWSSSDQLTKGVDNIAATECIKLAARLYKINF